MSADKGTPHPRDFEPYFSQWMLKLTEQGLHSKGDIALELARLETELATAQASILEMQRERDEAVQRMKAGWIEVCQSGLADAIARAEKAEASLSVQREQVIPEGHCSLFVPQGTPCALGGHCLAAEASHPRMTITDEMVNRFLSWPVPASVYPDGIPGKPGRIGTNLLSAIEARQMLEHVLAETPSNEREDAMNRAEASLSVQREQEPSEEMIDAMVAMPELHDVLRAWHLNRPGDVQWLGTETYGDSVEGYARRMAAALYKKIMSVAALPVSHTQTS